MRNQGDFDRKRNVTKSFVEAGEHVAYSGGVEPVSPARAHLSKRTGQE